MFPGSILNDMDSSAIVDKYDLFTFLDGSGKLENGDLGYMKARAFSWLYQCKNRCRQILCIISDLEKERVFLQSDPNAAAMYYSSALPELFHLFHCQLDSVDLE